MTISVTLMGGHVFLMDQINFFANCVEGDPVIIFTKLF